MCSPSAVSATALNKRRHHARRPHFHPAHTRPTPNLHLRWLHWLFRSQNARACLSRWLPDLTFYQQAVACQFACPVRTDARGYVTAIAAGDYERAYLIARENNPFASTCGWVCGAPCEAACRRGKIDAPIAIRALKRFVNDRYGVYPGRNAASRAAPGLARLRRPERHLRPGQHHPAHQPHRAQCRPPARPTDRQTRRHRRRWAGRPDLRPRSGPAGPERGDLRRGLGGGRHAAPGRARISPAARSDRPGDRIDPAAGADAQAQPGSGPRFQPGRPAPRIRRRLHWHRHLPEPQAQRRRRAV